MNRIKAKEECNLHNIDKREICFHKKIRKN